MTYKSEDYITYMYGVDDKLLYIINIPIYINKNKEMINKLLKFVQNKYQDSVCELLTSSYDAPIHDAIEVLDYYKNVKNLIE